MRRCTSRGLSTGRPSTSMMMSPGRRPAASAGLPLMTSTTSRPLLRPIRAAHRGGIGRETPATPRCARRTLPSRTRAPMMRSVVALTGTARPRPTPASAVLMPTTRPAESASAPPELPGLRAASVWMTSSITRTWAPDRVGSERPRALTTPAVTLPARPRGLPMATTSWPTRSADASPRRAGGRSPCSATSTARSESGSRPRTRNRSCRPSARSSRPPSPPATTCAEVTRYPSELNATAEPLPSGERPPREVTCTAATDGASSAATCVSVREYASSNSPSSLGSADIGTFGPRLLNSGECSAEALDPLGLMLADKADAPRECLAAAAGDTRLDERVEHAAILEPEPGHDRDAQGGEELLDATAAGSPGDLAAEEALGVAGDLDACVASVAPESGDPGAASSCTGAFGGVSGKLGLIDLADDQDLVGIGGDGGGRLVEPLGQAAGEPAGDFVVGERVGSTVSFHGLHDYTVAE